MATKKRGQLPLVRVAKNSPESRLAPKTHWEAKWVGVIKGYPKTPELFEQRRQRGREKFAALRAAGVQLTRKGVRDGWAGRQEEIKTLKEKAAEKADEIMRELIAEGRLMDEDSGNEALRIAFKIANDESEKSEVRLKAIKIVTEFTKSKPTTKVSVDVSPAEAWLASIAAQSK